MRHFANFGELIDYASHQIEAHGVDVDPGRWQGVATEGRPDMVTTEVINFQASAMVKNSIEAMQVDIQPNLPWADYEFYDRVRGYPTNPHKSLEAWPWWHGQSDTTQEEGVFSHTYSERFWPKHANLPSPGMTHRGIRYAYGDLDDVVEQLRREPLGRQATFPIFFPEDTGAVHGGRVPCTLHYHFLMRNNMLNMWYPIRSCDFIRHFKDDLYLAARLMLWVLDRLQGTEQIRNERDYAEEKQWIWSEVEPGALFFTAYSLHVHKGDWHHFMQEGL